MRRFIFICTAVLFLVSCQSKYKGSWGLELDYETISVSSQSDKTPLSIYASGAWTAELVKGSNWARLDRTSGSGVSTISLLFSANEGFSRTAVVRFSADLQTKEVTVIQTAGLKLPQIQFEYSSIEYSRATFSQTLCFDSNIPASFFEQARLKAFNEDDSVCDWITDLAFVPGEEESPETCEIPGAKRRKITYHVNPNTTGSSRSCGLKLGILTEDEVEYADTVSVVQTAEASYLELPSNVIVDVKGGTKSCAVQSNLASVLSDATLSVTYPGEDKDFISNPRIEGGRVYFDITENLNESMKRYASITISYEGIDGESAQASTSVVQNVDIKNFHNFSILSKEDLILWNTSSEKWSNEDHISLETDIVLEGEIWEINDFAGVFNGNGHTISGLTGSGFLGTLSGSLTDLTINGEYCVSSITDNSDVFCAAVHNLVGNGSIKSLTNNASITVECAFTSGSAYIGGVCAKASTADSIAVCRNTGNIIVKGKGKNLYAGGIIGYTDTNKPAVVGCVNEGNLTFTEEISGTATLGGIIGNNKGGARILRNCSNSGNISINNKAGYNYPGGIVGNLSGTGSDGDFVDCINTGNVINTGTMSTSGDRLRMGGIIGNINPGAGYNVNFINCTCKADVINRTEIKARHEVGGIIGWCSASNCTATLDGCIFVGTVSSECSTPASTRYVGALVGFIPYTKTISAFSCGVAGTVQDTVLSADNFADYMWTSKNNAEITTSASKPNYYYSE